MKFQAVLIVAMAVAVAGAQAPAPAAEARVAFGDFVLGLKADALARGIKAETVAAAFDGLEPLPVVVERDRTQAETVLTITQYVQRRLTKSFIRTAQAQAAAQHAVLAKVSDRYGAPPAILVAVWGMESNFGRFSGVRPTVQALATLAWEGRRGAFFTGELMSALAIADRGDIELAAMKGSWAGAMGQTQFMPSSYLAHAQDFDGDGRRDIWTSVPDVFASIANYLKAYGWVEGQAWGREVKLPAGRANAIVQAVGLRDSGCRAEREMTRAVPLSKWQALGVRTAAGAALPKVERNASLLRAGAKSYLVYKNYEALLGYNCAHAYALSVGLLSDRIGH
ncbi:MAG: lytic murein transglycosylase [Vicinamibacterales bacterium]